ncbi:mitotic spindle assembly checkpoint protein MAD2B-like isoform X2 [Bombyx mandarina]|uniref:Mitotic spindle assembly checkpoint protein MAD2B-like isoform X1 n=1 Tax=Bombyx mandarina TaxID=7092 RepID=A0A6J2K5F8_BOMMA|nr:mitotic spindle assembly checkpoint protein MAD2B-like isoform X1 [Bombyx mandarina]XP_028036228.1 mitotic spindle assembly checkpoint protein MAD2B-like isoform X2 [Bombyx mandarina]
MDPCFVDVTLEFLAVAFHSILFYTRIYHENIFEMRRKYNFVVYHCFHPEVNRYIDMCLKSIAECLKSDTMQRIEFATTDEEYKPLIKFVFDFEKNFTFDDTSDAYLINCEQNLRAFCLKLSSMVHRFVNLPENKSFTIFIHTNESTVVNISTNPDLEEFPLVEVDFKQKEAETIIPIRRLTIRNHNIDTYIEFI